MCMITDKVAETIRGNVTDELADGKHRVTPQIVFNLNFFMPGMGPIGSSNGYGSAGSMLAQSGATMLSQSSSAMGV